MSSSKLNLCFGGGGGVLFCFGSLFLSWNCSGGGHTMSSYLLMLLCRTDSS